jgi:hypothetical protein
MNSWQQTIPEKFHPAAQDAISSAFGTALVTSMEPLRGGGSGALAFRLAVGDQFYLLRMETWRGPMRNPHQYRCMQTAAGAGLAPPIRYANDDTGTVIIDFVAVRPLDTFPGGPLALASALGELVQKLQATEPFPVLGDYRFFLQQMLKRLAGLAAPGLLDPHVEAFERIRQAYPWDAASHVSSHNDPNPHNILFDGERLWLIDWETAYRNDPLTDVAVLAENHASTPELEGALLRSWLNREPDPALRARLRLMRQMTRLYYAGLLLLFSIKPSAVLTDLAAPAPHEFAALITSGQLKHGPDVHLALGKTFLAGFLAGATAPDFEEALKTAQSSS